MMKDLKVNYIETDEEFRNHADSVYNMLTQSYAPIEGLYSYRNLEDFIDKQPF